MLKHRTYKALLGAMALLCLSTFAGAQNWSGILAVSRAIDWSSAGAGVIPPRATICQSLTSTATFTTIRNALLACNNTGQTVFLAAGNYTMTDSINVPGIFNVTLRGAGPDQTNVNFTSFGAAGSGVYVENSPGFDTTYSGDPRVQDTVPGPCGTGSQCTNQSRWTAAAYTAGITALNLTTHNNLFVGSAINLDQVDNTADPSPNGGPYTMQDAAHATDGGASNIGRPGKPTCDSTNTANGCRGFSQQVTIVSCGTAVQGAACTSNSVVVTPGLYGTLWSASNLPGAWWSPVVPATGFGVEEMTLSVSGTGVGGGNAMIYFQSMAYSWVKHVKIVNGTTSATAFHKHIWFYGSNHMTARDSYMYGSRCSSESYGVDTGYNSSDNLVENNIFQKVATATIREGDAGSVFGYNYAVDNCYNGGIQQGDAYSHGIADHFGLWEGNIGSEMELDDIHGTNFLHTAFRNRYSGFDTGTENGTNTGPFIAMQLYAGSRDHNLVGNINGLAGKTTGYSAESATSTDTAANGNSVYVLGYSGFGGSHVGCCNNDPFVPASVARIANWDNVSNTVRMCNGNNSNLWPGGLNSACTKDELADTAPVTPALASPSTTLPASFYLSAKPAWWPSGIPYPPIGPDVSGGNIANTGGHANLNPAADCYLNQMGGATDGSSGPLAFPCVYTSTPTASAPTFSPVAGIYNSTQTVTMSTTSPGCNGSIWWNTTGIGQGTNGTTAIVATSETLFAQVLSCPGFSDSAVGQASYTINQPTGVSNTQNGAVTMEGPVIKR